VVQGYAFDDPVAVDTALAGFCMSNPTPADVAALEKAAGKVYLGSPAFAARPQWKVQDLGELARPPGSGK
jgi:hypothetical protein